MHLFTSVYNACPFYRCRSVLSCDIIVIILLHFSVCSVESLQAMDLINTLNKNRATFHLNLIKKLFSTFRLSNISYICDHTCYVAAGATHLPMTSDHWAGTSRRRRCLRVPRDADDDSYSQHWGTTWTYMYSRTNTYVKSKPSFFPESHDL